ncbi:response regulator transcription factor [Fulvivirga lutea]|uniref:Response regulator transcription factor n=1 Tax=Fulvivirga lutea TaxID=2810512 RepID=A0A974WHF6_9BACT|nr:response regulator transcription factor [Fulvivirga lutea]QSE98175.1 response regulator transcription factor [Fulvivirga lutea]
MSKWTIYIADDQTLFRKGMARLVKSFRSVKEVKEASNGKEMLELVKQQPPDAILMDLDMPVMDGVEATEKIIAKYPTVKIVILSMHNDYQHILYLMESGAHAFLQKNAEPEEVKLALESVIAKDFYQNELVVEALRKGVMEHGKKMSRPAFEGNSSLTDREKEVLHMICKELTMKEIGDKLSLSEKTIQNHRARIMEKIGARNTVGMVKYAFQIGLIK